MYPIRVGTYLGNVCILPVLTTNSMMYKHSYRGVRFHPKAKKKYNKQVFKHMKQHQLPVSRPTLLLCPLAKRNFQICEKHGYNVIINAVLICHQIREPKPESWIKRAVVDREMEAGA